MSCLLHQSSLNFHFLEARGLNKHFLTSSSLLSKQDSLIFAVMYTCEVILFPYMAFEVSTALDQNMTTQL